MFIPDDTRLRTFASGIAEQRRHSLRKLERDDDGFGRRPGADDDAPRDPADAPDAGDLADEDGQLSLFTALSAVPLDDQGRRLETGRVYEDPDAEAIPDYVGATVVGGAAVAPVGAAEAALTLTAAPVPLPEPEPAGAAGAPAAASPRVSALARRRQLRDANASIVADLVHLTGRSHAELNAELNRRVGIRRITEATVRQLDLRHQAALKMLTRRN